jgi:hypothetical protein
MNLVSRDTALEDTPGSVGWRSLSPAFSAPPAILVDLGDCADRSGCATGDGWGIIVAGWQKIRRRARNMVSRRRV